MQPTLLYKKFLCVFMSLMIVFISTQSAYATTSVGGWTALDTITAGANNTINATKTAGGKVLKSAVAVAPSAVKVGKHLIKGGGQAALVYAVVELLGEGIDWVMDAENNRIKYFPNGQESTSDGQWYTDVYGPSSRYDTPLAASQAMCRAMGRSYVSHTVSGSKGTFVCNDYGSLSTHNLTQVAGGTVTPPKEEYLPIDTVATKVIANASAGHAPSQESVKAVALEGFAAGEHDAALDAAATPDAGTENPPVDTPTDPTKPFDPSSILSALAGISAILAGIMSALTGFVDWWKAQWTTFSTGITGFFEWVRAEPDTASLQPEPVEVSEGTLVDGWQDKANAGYVNLGSTQCPSDVLIPISYMGASTNLSISYVPFCHFASIIRYAVILGAWVAALMIISGGRTRE